MTFERLLARLRCERRLAWTAAQFLTRVPAPAGLGFHPTWLTRSLRHFPLVGAAIGGLGALVAGLALHLWSPAVAALLAVGTTVWLTVAFHEDGLADTADALLGAAPRERALEILKDSRIGTYGAAALALTLGLRVTLLAGLLATNPALAAAALVASHAMGRATAVLLMASLPYAGALEQAKAGALVPSARATDARLALCAGLPWLLLAAAFGGLRPALLAAIGLIGLMLLMRAWLQRRLGGCTGDGLGATEQLGEIVVLLAFAAELSA